MEVRNKMNNDMVVDVSNLSKAFTGKKVLKDCSMSVRQGTIYGFLGANGAGKTTVFKILSGLLTPTSGKVEILGMDSVSHRNQILKNIGIIIDIPIFYEQLSAAENLRIHLGYMDMQNNDILSTLKIVGLADTGKQAVSKFSLGMRQRLAIARAIIHKPKLLILDEPINGLDPMGIREMRELFLNLVQNQGMTILVSSHILSEIEYIADKIGVLVDGTVVLEVALSEIKNECPTGLEEYFMNIMRGVKHA